MNFTALASRLKLAYPPISSYEFQYLKDEEIVQEHLEKSMLYILAQRPVLSFEKIIFYDDKDGCTFEIHKQGSENILKCELPFLQSQIQPNANRSVFVELGTHNETEQDPSKIFSNVHAIKIFNHEDEFIMWLSPDKYIYEYLNGSLKCNIIGDLTEFIGFHVHYVGKATEQKIWKRLKSHSTLQEILTLERPVVKGTLPAHEITLLLFKVDDVVSVSYLDDDVDSFVKNSLEPNLPTSKTISLDAEKMLVKLLNPEYNDATRRFPNYPKSSDGLSPMKYSKFTYQILDTVSLQYKGAEICGNFDQNKADIILIDNNERIEIIKPL